MARLGTDIPTFRPGEFIGDSVRLQQEQHRIPSADSVPTREFSDKRSLTYKWVKIILILLLIWFAFLVIVVMD